MNYIGPIALFSTTNCWFSLQFGIRVHRIFSCFHIAKLQAFLLSSWGGCGAGQQEAFDLTLKGGK